MKYERKTLIESFEQVESARPIILPNEGFVAQLQQFEKELEALQGTTGDDLKNATERINWSDENGTKKYELLVISIKLKILRIIIPF